MLECFATVYHLAPCSTDIAQIALRVEPQVCADAEPDVLLATARKVVEDDRRDLPALSDARAIAEEEPCALRLVVGAAGRQEARVPLACIQGAFQLQFAQQPTFNNFLAQSFAQRVVRRRKRDARHGGRLGDVV